MVRVTLYRVAPRKMAKPGKTYYLARFPNFPDMVRLCRDSNIRAGDFEHYHTEKKVKEICPELLEKWRKGLVYVGWFGSGNVTGGKKTGDHFVIECEHKPTLSEVVR